MARSSRDLRVLIVDDEQHMVDTLTVLLEPDYDVLGVGSAQDALNSMGSFSPDIVLLDITLPGMDGLECLEKSKERYPDIEVVMVTATREVRTAVRALKLGAFDYLEKPFEEEDLRAIIRNIREKLLLRRRVSTLGSELARPYGFENIVGRSRAMQAVFGLVRSANGNDLNVLIQGESGTGKELVARAIHYNGSRRDGPFIAANCARFSGSLVESELFGHEKGAFTGAAADHRGVFERADGGTLFLDEIATMPMGAQGKLLRVLEEKRFTRVGGENPIEVDVRLTAATNTDLQQVVLRGEFREDLYYRLNVIPITVPPLRSRREDIPSIASHFIRKHRTHMNSPLEGFTPEAMRVLKNHTWRGNVRELENTVLLLMSLSEKRVADAADLAMPVLRRDDEVGGIRESRANAEKKSVLEALRENNWNQTLAAKQLGVHRNTLRSMMKRHGVVLRPPEGGD